MVKNYGPFDLLIFFIISLRLALLGSTTKPRKARGVRASPLGDSVEVDRCTSDVRFHPRYRKLLVLLPVFIFFQMWNFWPMAVSIISTSEKVIVTCLALSFPYSNPSYSVAWV